MHIAVFLPNWIGDAVMATPAVRALRETFRDAHLVGVFKPYIAGVVEGSNWFDSVLHLDSKGPLSQRWWSVARQLRGLGIDTAVLFPNTLRSAMTAWLGGCKQIIGFSRYARRWLLTDALQPCRGPDGAFVPSPVIDDYNRLAELAGCAPPGRRMELFTTPADESAADAVWRTKGFMGRSEVVCLNPGAAFGSSKHWSVESFAALAQELVDRRGCGVLVLCGPSERDMARKVVELTSRPGVASLAEEPISIGLTKACVRRCDLLVTTDSGPRHFAVAFDRPVVTLFGPTHIAWTETYYPQAIHLQKKVDCGPCQLRVCPVDHCCMKLLTPSEVFDAAQQLLGRAPKKKAS